VIAEIKKEALQFRTMIMQNLPLHRFQAPVPGDQCQRVIILLVPGFSNLTLAGIMEPLRAANRMAGHRVYDIVLASLDGRPARSSSGLEIAVQQRLAEVQAPELLLIVSSFEADAFCKPEALRQLRRIAGTGCLMGGMESGAYILARAGLLDGYRATFHWEDYERLRELFPEVRVAEERYVVDRDRATSGGAIPTLDFAINLLRHQQGFALALEVASTFIYEQESSPRDAQRTLSLGRLKWAEPHISAAVELMESNLQEPLSIAEIARRVGISERSLHRDFRRILGSSPRRFYQWARLNAARRLLLQTDLPVAEVALASGFEDRSAFSRAFKSRFGEAPRSLRGEGPRGTLS
jgi:transcriptional regulator GlxA family with amidase domain